MKTSEWTRNCVGFAVLGGFFAALGGLHYIEIPPGNKEVVLLLIGQVSGAFGTIVGYFYQTTLGSSRKTEALAKAVAPQGEPT